MDDYSLYNDQIISLLRRLYAMLQGFYPDLCRDNPFLSLVQERTYAELCELHVAWTQSIEDCQAQLRAVVPEV